MDNNSTLVYLSEIEANEFVLFQKYYNCFKLLLERKIFDQKAATITLHFNNLGEIVNITRQDLLYLKGANFINDNEKVDGA